ncbi:MAG: DUF2118 domain-containing protein, partial [Alphaproteobacteria bacterium]
SARRSGGRTDAGPFDCVVTIDDTDHAVTLSRSGAAFMVAWDGLELLLESDWRPGESLFHATLDGIAVTVQVAQMGTRLSLSWRGAASELTVRSPRAAELATRMPKREPKDLSRFLLSPMPGLMVSLAVNEGDEVRAGQALAVVDAMKMENVLRAERDGVVAHIKVAQGDSLSVDQVIMEFA